jgi:hypothetical protein
LSRVSWAWAAALRKLLEAADAIACRRCFARASAVAVACGLADDNYHGQGSRDAS